MEIIYQKLKISKNNNQKFFKKKISFKNKKK